MRVLVVDTYYPAFLRRHYEGDPGLAGQPYELQLRSLLDACFGTSDAYSVNLRGQGHEAVDVIVNCEPLQSRWAAEHGAARWSRRLGGALRGRPGLAAKQRALAEIARAQIAEWNPDVVYCQDLSAFALGELDRLRANGLFLAGQIASPAPERERLRRYHLITTSLPHFVERFRALGVDSEYLQIGFHAAVTERLARAGVSTAPTSDRPYGAVFVGGIDPRIHGRGTDFLAALCERTDIDVWGYGADALPHDSPILRRYHGEAWGLDMYRVLASARIAVNRHIDIAEDYSNNMRMFEATGVGALLATESSRNLGQLFAPPQEAIACNGLDDLVGELRRLLADDDDRRTIAARGQARTLTSHTYDRVISDLVGMLESRLERR